VEERGSSHSLLPVGLRGGRGGRGGKEGWKRKGNNVITVLEEGGAGYEGKKKGGRDLTRAPRKVERGSAARIGCNCPVFRGGGKSRGEG